MSRSITDARQVTLRQFLSQITNAATYAGTADSKPANQAEVDNLLAAINDEVTPLLRLSASSTPNLVVTVGAAIKANSESSYQHSIPHIGALLPNSFSSGTVTFPSASGGTITVSPGTNGTLTVSSGNFIKILIYMDATGALNVLPGTQNAVEASATVTAAPKKTLPIGYVTLQNVAGVIQNIAQNKIYQFGSGAGSGSSSGSGTGDDLDALLFRASFTDKFDEGPTDSASAVDVGAAKTDSTAYSFANALYQLNYDASKTIAAGTTTTNINLSAVAAFTVKTGDVVIANNQARKITAVASQSSFTTEAFSVAPTLAGQVTVSQAVHTLDVYNLAVDGVALSAAFSGATFQDVLLDYEDTSAVGDAIFDVNTTPVVAASASADGTTFTDLKLRATLETDTMNSFLLPAAGTGLYLRFFANKTSGTGIVNVLGYRAFMQKSTVATAGGITNSSYVFTNGVGTPVNATVSVVGGKTTITLPWQYALGVYSGTSASSIEVWLNGQKLPRFINSTLTPDGSFLETSSNVVTLDSDYSALNLAVEIFQRTQIVDNSTINTTNIAYQQEVMQNGFQAFVAQNQLMNATTNTGTPVAGTFYSTVVGRAPMVDLSQDMRPRMGIQRVMTPSVYQLQNEFGPNGELVWATPNDLFGEFRYVGFSNPSLTDNYGQRLTSTVSGDFIEITFYGTGLNLILENTIGATNFTASVDGGASGANLWPTTVSSILGPRNYGANQILAVVSSLSLGVHTVKITLNSSTGWSFGGYEILNESSSVKVNPGVSYIAGQKLPLSSQSAFAYNAAATGTRGGRVLVYQKSDGTIAQSFQAVGSALSYPSADHTNEEPVRTHYPLEFGANRSDDFSTLTGSATIRAFTLDDGTTNLTSSSAAYGGVSGNNFSLANNNGTYFTLTFIGTGLDVEWLTDAVSGSDNYTFQIDGGTPVSWPTNPTAISSKRTIKVASGLAYGTHTFRFNRVTAAAYQIYMSKFIVYQPKKPTLPSGAVELADYNVMATFAASASPLVGIVSSGVLRKYGLREVVYLGSASIVTDFTNFDGGFTTNQAAGNSFRYVFFGTGFEWHTYFNAGTNNISVSVDGSAPSATIYQQGSGLSYSAGTISGTAVAGQGRVSVSGLTLGLHTLTITCNTNNIYTDSLDIITPIHSARSNIYVDQQNTLPVGSTAISDNRKLTPVKDVVSATKAWAKAIGITSAPTTTSTVPVPMPEMSCTIKTTGGPLRISFNTSLLCGSGQEALFQLYVDGVPVDGVSRSSTSGSAESNTALTAKVAVSPGFHKVDTYWLTTGGTLTAVTVSRFLLVEET